MQKIVEDFDFEQEYNKAALDPKVSTQGSFKPAADPNSDKMTSLYQSQGDVHGVISYNLKIYDEKHK